MSMAFGLRLSVPIVAMLVLVGCGGDGVVQRQAAPLGGEASLPAVEASAVVSAAPAKRLVAQASELSAWIYDEAKDEMRGKSRYTAALISENKVSLAFPYDGGVGMRVLLRDDPEFGKDVMLIVDKGQMPCYAYQGCSFKARFDDGPIQKFPAAGAENGSSEVIFLDGPASRKRFMSGLRKAKKLVIEVAMYDAGRQQFFFAPSGLKWDRF